MNSEPNKITTDETVDQSVKKPVKKSSEKETYVFKRYKDVNYQTGLTAEIVEKRIAHGYCNINDNKMTKSGWQIVSDNLFTFFNMLYIILTVLLCLANSWSNLTFLVVVIPNTVISIYQEFKAKKIVEQLSLVIAPVANVIRDSQKTEIPIDQIVIDDIILFVAGNQIAADSIIVNGTVEVNESMITGESDSIVKKDGDMLYSGSFIVSGSCYAQVEHVGKDNYIEKLASEAKQLKSNKSELLRTLNWIIKIIGIIIVPLAGISLWQGITKSGGATAWEKFVDVIPNVSGSVIGMIPSGLFLLTTIALSFGVRRLARKNNTLVHQLYCIEMLARVDVLCLDKTGTITDGTMRVIDCIEVKNTTDYTIREIVGSMMNSFTDTNATSEALIRFFDVNTVLKPVNVVPFSSKRKFSAVTFENVGTFYLGAPEFILYENYEKIKSKVERFAAQGCRVLVIGHTTGSFKGDLVPKNAKAIGLIVIQDHIREEAFETIKYFKENGVDVKVISGDNPLTVSEIAHRVGVPNAGKYISLEQMTDDEVKEIAFDYAIFGRVTPSQKRALVEAYQAKKKTVAMTGDGVNDILALKEADCSIAMASGSDATKYVANIVLMDSNFASMPAVVAEGRRVINNIQRTSTLFLVKTIFTILLTIFYMLPVIGQKYPFQSSQLLLIEFFIIGLPSTIISLQPNKEKVQGRFISNVLRSSLPGALTVVIFHVLLYVIGKNIGSLGWYENDTITSMYVTISLLSTIFICMTVLYRMCKPFNTFKKILFAVVLVVSLLLIIFACTGWGFGDFVNNYLKLSFDLKLLSDITEPTSDAAVLTTFLNVLILLIMVLLIDPFMNLIEKFLGTARNIKL